MVLESNVHSAFNNCSITINANISLSVKHDSDYASEEGDDSEDSALESLPNFQIEIQRGDTVLRLFCTYLTVDPEGDYSREDNDEPSAPQGKSYFC